MSDAKNTNMVFTCRIHYIHLKREIIKSIFILPGTSQLRFNTTDCQTKARSIDILNQNIFSTVRIDAITCWGYANYLPRYYIGKTDRNLMIEHVFASRVFDTLSTPERGIFGYSKNVFFGSLHSTIIRAVFLFSQNHH